MVGHALAGDPVCRTLVTEAGHMLGIGIANIVNLNSPDRVVLGGELSGAGEILFAPLRKTLNERAVAPAVAAARIVPANLAPGPPRAEPLP
jgi:predicted NBD/HSP70 family sugar kinase